MKSSLYVCITTLFLTLQLLGADNNKDSDYQLERETETYIVETLKTGRRKRVQFQRLNVLGLLFPRLPSCITGPLSLLPGQRIRHKGKQCAEVICDEDGQLDFSVCDFAMKPIQNCLKDRGDPNSFYPKCCRYIQCNIVNNELRGVLL